MNAASRTAVQPGAVDTAMFKPERPLPCLVRWLFVASPEKVARQIVHAIRRRAGHIYVTKRYALIALLFKLLP
jgi:short-subunit dehydrogenase